MSRLLRLITFLTFFIFHFRRALAVTRPQFTHWYPEYRDIFRQILRENCSEEYQYYLYSSMNKAYKFSFTGGAPTTQLSQPVVQCILQSTSEFIKSNMASAQVLLGLTPTMLATLGPSTEETSVLFVVGRRPILSLCIAAGSTALFPMRAFEHRDPVGLLRERGGRLEPPRLMREWASMILILEYAIVAAAVVNIVSVSKELGQRTTSSFAPQLVYLLLLWAFLIVIGHIAGYVTLLLRIGFDDDKKLFNHVFDWLKFQITSFDRQRPIKIEVKRESYWWMITSYWTALLTICHVIFGTLTLSSLTFITVRDSLTVIARYFASVMACRIVLMYELACLRHEMTKGTITDK